MLPSDDFVTKGSHLAVGGVGLSRRSFYSSVIVHLPVRRLFTTDRDPFFVQFNGFKPKCFGLSPALCDIPPLFIDEELSR